MNCLQEGFWFRVGSELGAFAVGVSAVLILVAVICAISFVGSRR
ncbi:hypothetical protein B0G81_6790 [Paraburkholderia sp. BL6665CI2N2]|nr:hypothetical protein B0G81_6790 [Paraburkholderia sp. BL6665CI2N2]